MHERSGAGLNQKVRRIREVAFRLAGVSFVFRVTIVADEQKSEKF